MGTINISYRYLASFAEDRDKVTNFMYESTNDSFFRLFFCWVIDTWVVAIFFLYHFVRQIYVAIKF